MHETGTNFRAILSALATDFKAMFVEITNIKGGSSVFDTINSVLKSTKTVVEALMPVFKAYGKYLNFLVGMAKDHPYLFAAGFVGAKAMGGNIFNPLSLLGGAGRVSGGILGPGPSGRGGFGDKTLDLVNLLTLGRMPFVIRDIREQISTFTFAMGTLRAAIVTTGPMLLRTLGQAGVLGAAGYLGFKLGEELFGPLLRKIPGFNSALDGLADNIMKVLNIRRESDAEKTGGNKFLALNKEILSCLLIKTPNFDTPSV